MGSWPPPTAPGTLHATRPPRAQRAQISRLPYLPGLDGLRAVAVAAVMVYHANHEWLGGGFLGVEVFFVISGYLITLLLIAEHERAGHVRLGQFWLRRARRLLPALFVTLGALAVYMALFDRRPQGQTRGDFLGGIFYGSNWYQIFVGQGYTAAEAFAPLRHLWSLAVEEQFYLIWPLVMVLVLRLGRDRLPRMALWLAGLSAAITVATGLLYAGGDIHTTCAPDAMHGYWKLFGRCISIDDTLYLNTFSRASGLMLGAAFAFVWRPVAVMRGPLRSKGRAVDGIALLGMIALGALMWWLQLSESGTNFGIRFDPWLYRGGFLLIGLATLMVIAGVTHRGAVAGPLMGNPLFRWAGTRSYGLYLFHWPVYQIIRKQAGIPMTGKQLLVAMAITIPVTEASYRFVEMPVRRGRLAEWLRGERRPRTVAALQRRREALVGGAVVAGLLAFATVSIATADNLCVGAITCSLQTSAAGAPPVGTTASTVPQVDPSATTLPVETSVPATAVPGQTTVPPPETTLAPTTTGPPAPPPAMQAFGDSVMAGAFEPLTAAGFAVDAAQDRQGTQLADILAALRATNSIAPVVVIQIGTNGSVSDATFDRIMASLPANLVPTVRFLTVRASKGWIDGNNQRIANLPARYPNVQVVDWAGVSNTIALCSDGTHIACSKASEQAYANMIFDAIGRPDLKK